MTRRLIATALAGLAVLVVLAEPAAASGRFSRLSPSLALFEGRTIDLSQGWGEAQGCLVFNGAGIVECFRSGDALHAREAKLAGSSAMLAACSSPLRLYTDIYCGGRELALYDRGYWQNLSTWSFDDQLSSYKVGACGVRLAENAYGGGAWYPGSTSGGSWEPFMLSGWDNRVSSIYIQ